MRRSGRIKRRRHALEFEVCEPRRLLSGFTTDTFVATYGPQPATPLELPQSVSPGSALSSVALNDATWLASLGLTGGGQTIAVIDSGIAFDHEALGAGFGPGHKVIGGWDFAENDASPYDDGPAGFHGTHIAGILAGRDGFRTGVAPDAQLVALRVFNDAGATQAEWIQSALRWVHEHRFDYASPITTVNLSIGTANAAGDGSLAKALEKDLAQLRADNIFVAVSAGNHFRDDAPTELSYPASSSQVVPVASLDATGQLSDFSQRNSRVLAAPGEEIISTAPDYLLGADGRVNDYVAATGTSMAAPYVAGASVLVRDALRRTTGHDPSVAQIEQALRDGADPIYDPATQLAIARIQLRRTVERILTPQATDDVQVALPTSIPSWPAGDAWSWTASASVNSRESWHHWQAARTGVATLLGPSDSTLEVFDRAGRRLASSRSTPRGERLDVNVWEGDELYFRVTGLAASAPIRLSNLVRLDGKSLVISDTPAADQLDIAWDVTVSVTLNGVDYQFPESAVQTIDMASQRGADRVRFDSSRSTATWRAILSPTITEVRSNTATVRLSGATQVELAAGLQRDEATLVDGLEDDSFRLEAGTLQWTTADRDVRLYGFDDVKVTATRGGMDRATLTDSQGADLLDLRGSEARWTVGPVAYVLQGIEQLTADASRGGNDRVNLRDSLGDDQLETWPDRIEWRTSTLTANLHGFPQLVAAANTGGNDTATIHGGAGDDLVRLSETETQVVSTGLQSAVTGFGSIVVDGGVGGRDWVSSTSDSIRIPPAVGVDAVRTVRLPDATIKIRNFGASDSSAASGASSGSTPSTTELAPSPDDRVKAIDFLYKKLGLTP